MRLNHGIQLAYCTNIHRGETWEDTLAGLEAHTLRVRERVCPAGEDFAIGLRLSAEAAAVLARPEELDRFRGWLDKNGCSVFTINGFPYGAFHGQRVKEQVYAPDWTDRRRVDYTKQLFTILSALVSEAGEGSVSTLPGSFKEFITDDGSQGDAIISNLAEVCEHIELLAGKTGQDLHLGLEPEPLGWFETSGETVAFFERFRAAHGHRFDQQLGVNYDCCHLAVEHETADAAIGALRKSGTRISKLHLSSALALDPTAENLARLRDFSDDVYLHQVVARGGDGSLTRIKDLPAALAAPPENAEEWRVHFHVPLHASCGGGFRDTRDHVLGAMDLLAAEPSLCRHLEMETYTWEVLPAELREGDVVDQLEREYEWTLGELRSRGLAS